VSHETTQSKEMQEKLKITRIKRDFEKKKKKATKNRNKNSTYEKSQNTLRVQMKVTAAQGE
jgi:hypothetical protein